jgi:hypothetical protein
MVTIIIFNQYEFGITYHVFKGDYSYLNGIYINQSDNWDELNKLLYGKIEGGSKPLNKITLEEFNNIIINNKVKIIECGFYS